MVYETLKDLRSWDSIDGVETGKGVFVVMEFDPNSFDRDRVLARCSSKEELGVRLASMGLRLGRENGRDQLGRSVEYLTEESS